MLPASNDRRPNSSRDLPDLSQIVATLAADNARVINFVNNMPVQVDRIVQAAERNDWTEVRKESETLARTSLIYGHPSVSDSARGVCRELDKPNNELGVQKSLLKLLATCGTARVPRPAGMRPNRPSSV